jgi:hypothetical protein
MLISDLLGNQTVRLKEQSSLADAIIMDYANKHAGHDWLAYQEQVVNALNEVIQGNRIGLVSRFAGN